MTRMAVYYDLGMYVCLSTEMRISYVLDSFLLRCARASYQCSACVMNLLHSIDSPVCIECYVSFCFYESVPSIRTCSYVGSGY